MRSRILRLKQKKSLYSIALDIGISEYSLYCYVNNYNKVGVKTINRIKEYLRRGKRNENKSNK